MTIIICDRTECMYNKKYPILPPYEYRCQCDAIGMNKDGCDSFGLLPEASQPASGASNENTPT